MSRVRLKSRKCKIIAWFFTIAAVPILAWSISSTTKIWLKPESVMLLGLSLGCAAFCAPRIPYAVFFMGLLYPMMAGTVLGPGGAVIATALYAVPAVLFVRPERMAGFMIFSVMVCNAYLYGFAYRMVEAYGIYVQIIVVATISFLMFYPLIQGGFKWRIPWVINPLLCAIGATAAEHADQSILLLAMLLSPIQCVIYAWSRILGTRWKREQGESLEEVTSF